MWCRTRLFNKSGSTNAKFINIKHRGHRFMADIFTTVVDMKWRWLMLIFILGEWTPEHETRVLNHYWIETVWDVTMAIHFWCDFLLYIKDFGLRKCGNRCYRVFLFDDLICLKNDKRRGNFILFKHSSSSQTIFQPTKKYQTRNALIGSPEEYLHSTFSKTLFLFFDSSRQDSLVIFVFGYEEWLYDMWLLDVVIKNGSKVMLHDPVRKSKLT